MTNDSDQERLIELVGRLCDQEISDQEVIELEQLLQSSSEARQLYHLTVSLQRDLESCDIGEARAEFTTVAASLKEENRSWRSLGLVALAASVLLGIFGFGYVLMRGEYDPIETASLATITDLVDVQWGETDRPLNVGAPIGAQRLRLAAGAVRLTYTHGVVVTVEGPADFELTSIDHATLHSGQMVAYVPEGAEGYRVSTESTDVIDLGTEFGVTAKADGTSEVVVFDGEVDLSPNNGGDPTMQRVVAGLAYRVDRDGTTHWEVYRQSRFEKARSVLRGRDVIRESFRTDKSFPGKAQSGWTTPWSVEPTNLVVNKKLTGIQAEKPLFPGTQKFLTVSARGANEGETSNLRLARSFDSYEEFDANEPYTVEFAFRLECDPSKIQRIQIVGIDTSNDAADIEPSWRIRAGSFNAGLQWRVYHPGEGERHFDSLPVRQGTAYRFLIEVHPQDRRWRASISNGKETIWNTLRNGEPLRLKNAGQNGANTLAWEVESAADIDLRFSLDAIRIQNRPAMSKVNQPRSADK